MSDPHRIMSDAFNGIPWNTGVDPASGGPAIVVNKQLWNQPIDILASAGETRQLLAPDRSSLLCLIRMRTATGKLTLTVQGTYDGTNSTIVMTAVAQWVLLISVETSPGLHQWRLIDNGPVSVETQAVYSATTSNSGSASAVAINTNLAFLSPSAASQYFKMPVLQAGARVTIINKVASSAILTGPAGESVGPATSLAIAATSYYDLATDGSNWFLC